MARSRSGPIFTRRLNLPTFVAHPAVLDAWAGVFILSDCSFHRPAVCDGDRAGMHSKLALRLLLQFGLGYYGDPWSRSAGVGRKFSLN